MLADPDGSGWRMRPGLTGEPAPAPAPGAPLLRYRMTVEPLNISTLPLLERARFAPLPAEGHPRWLRHRDGAWMADRPLAGRLQVQAQAVLDMPLHRTPAGAGTGTGAGTPGPAEPPPALRQDLALPDGRHPRTRAWAQAQLDADGRARHEPARAAHVAARLREFRNPASAEFFSVCDAPGSDRRPTPFQCLPDPALPAELMRP